MDEGGTIRAIETRFNGYKFRSRLEARWAVVFNHLHIPYNYEPEGYNLNGIFYLPDFWLPEQQCFFEVKGLHTDNDGPRKARLLALHSGKPVFMFGDIPTEKQALGGEDGGSAFYPGGEDVGYFLCRSVCCGAYGIQYAGWSNRIKCCDTNRAGYRVPTYDHDTILTAYDKARTRRFEKGERQ